MKLTEAKLKQMILNEMNSSPIDPTAELLAEKFKEARTDSPLLRQIYQLAIALGHAPEGGFIETLGSVEFVASPDLAQAMEHVMSGDETLDIYPIEERTISVNGKMVPTRKATELPGTYIVSYLRDHDIDPSSPTIGLNWDNLDPRYT
jgi:hypothetical protein